MIHWPRFLLAFCILAQVATAAESATSTFAYVPPSDVGDPAQLGQGIQRTMHLLATSTPEHRNTVRILFYGQSITEQDWWKEVAADLRMRFPHANLVIENRALGGYAAQRLVKTAETDLYPFEPDLLIFHVFGASDSYEDIIRRTRERTTAEILIQTDHVSAKEDWRHEPTDPAQVTPEEWASFMNYRHLPEVIRKYGCGFVDQRNLWKKYLRQHGIEANALLRDGLHLNESGCHLMAAFTKAALVERPGGFKADPMNCGYVRTFVVGRDVDWAGNVLRLSVDGSRIDLIAGDTDAGGVNVLIDDRKPSAHGELYQFSRAHAKPGGKWPPVAPIGSDAQLVLEEWELAARKLDGSPSYAFTLRGSVTGEDGRGRTDRQFVSNSKRVVIAPADWDVDYALGLAKIKPAPDAFTVTWSVVPRFFDAWDPAPVPAGIENVATAASGLQDTVHMIELRGERGALKAIRVYSPKRFPLPSPRKAG